MNQIELKIITMINEKSFIIISVCFSLIIVGIGAAMYSPTTSHTSADVGAGFLAYEAYQGNLDSDSVREGGAAVIMGSATATGGAVTASTSTAPAMVFGGTLAAGAGGALVA